MTHACLSSITVSVIACKQCSSNEQLAEASRVLHATSLSKCMSMHCFTYLYSYHYKTVLPRCAYWFSSLAAVVADCSL